MPFLCPAANMRKILQRIGAAERAQLSAGDLSSVIMSTRGDVRHAILTMQLQLKASKKKGRASRVRTELVSRPFFVHRVEPVIPSQRFARS